MTRSARPCGEVIEPMHIPGAGIRIASEFGWITAELAPSEVAR